MASYCGKASLEICTHASQSLVIRCHGFELETDAPCIMIVKQPPKPPNKIDRAAARFVSSGMIRNMDVNDLVDMTRKRFFEWLIHDGRVIEIINNTDLCPPDLFNHLERLGRRIEKIARVIDTCIERLKAKAHAGPRKHLGSSSQSDDKRFCLRPPVGALYLIPGLRYQDRRSQPFGDRYGLFKSRQPSLMVCRISQRDHRFGHAAGHCNVMLFSHAEHGVNILVRPQPELKCRKTRFCSTGNAVHKHVGRLGKKPFEAGRKFGF